MKIYAKIVLTTLPLVIFSLVAAVGTTYYFSYNALTSLAQSLLESRLSEAVETVRQQEAILAKYGLDNVPASVEKAQIDAGTAMLWIKIGDEGYIFVIDDGGLIAAHPDRSLVGRDVNGEDWFRKMVNSQEGGVDLTFGGVRYLAKYSFFNPWRWYILAVDPEQEVYRAINRMRPYVLSLGIVTLFIVALALMLVTRRLLAPLKSLTAGAEQIGKGNLKNSIAVRTDDEIGRLAGVFNKMTAQLEESLTVLRYKEKYFRSLIENATDIIAILDGDGNIIYNSPSLQRILGYPSEELFNKKFSRFVQPADLPNFMRFLQEMGRDPGIIGALEIRFRHKEGSWRTLEVMGNNLLDDQAVSGIVLNCRDVSQRRLAEDRLRKAEQKYRGIFENAVEGIYQCQRDGRFIAANPSFVKIMGYDCPSEFLSSNSSVAKQFYVNPKDFRRVMRLLDKKGRLSGFETQMYRKDGSKVWVTISARVIHHAGDDTAYYEGIILDITEKRKAEQTLKKNQQELRRLTNKLITAQEEERQRLARELHDDISQRLAVLSMDAGKIERRLNTKSDWLFDSFRRMQAELVNLSSDIHAISRRLHPSILEDLGLSDAIKSESEAIIKREGIVINYEAGSIPPDLSKDVSLCLYRILQEGIRNITKHAGATEINIYLTCQKNEICLAIEDNGQGFDLNEMDKKPGLGLASMDERIRFIGGNINIGSKPGAGTHILVKAPVKNKKRTIQGSGLKV